MYTTIFLIINTCIIIVMFYFELYLKGIIKNTTDHIIHKKCKKNTYII